MTPTTTARPLVPDQTATPFTVYVANRAANPLVLGTPCRESGGFVDCGGGPVTTGPVGVVIGEPYIFKDASPLVLLPGSGLTYTIQVVNRTGETVNNLRVEDTMPPGVQILSTAVSSGSLVVTGTQIVFTQSSLAAGASITITIRTWLSAAANFADITNTACLTSTGNAAPRCAVMSFSPRTVTQLPSTGEVPTRYPSVRWTLLLLAALLAVGAGYWHQKRRGTQIPSPYRRD